MGENPKMMCPTKKFYIFNSKKFSKVLKPRKSLFIHCLFNSNCNGNGHTNHWVVARAYKSHHFNRHVPFGAWLPQAVVFNHVLGSKTMHVIYKIFNVIGIVSYFVILSIFYVFKLLTYLKFCDNIGVARGNSISCFRKVNSFI